MTKGKKRRDSVPDSRTIVLNAVRTPSTREERLIAAYYTVLPSVVFQRLFNRKETFVRNRRNWLGLQLPKDVPERFAALEQLPALELLTPAERRIVMQTWNEMRGVSSSDPKEQHRINLLLDFSDELPGAVLARLLGVTLGAVQSRQRRLRLTRTPKEGAKLRRRFALLSEAPEYEQLSAGENALIAEVWAELRDFERTPKRVRQDAVLTELCDCVPGAVFAEWFGVTPGAIVFRRRTRGIALEKNPLSIMHAFRKSPTLPLTEEQLKFLKTRERKKLERIWQELHAEYLKERRAELAKREAALLTELRRRTRVFLKTHSEQDLSPCSHPECSHRWPRERLFFNSNWRSPDKLGHRCVVCQLRRLFAPDRRKNAPPIRLDEKTLKRATVIVQAIGELVPIGFLTQLIGVHQTPVLRIRQEAGIRPALGTNQDLLVWWAMSESPPTHPALEPSELGCLEWIWQRHKQQFWEGIEDDRGYRELMDTERGLFDQSPGAAQSGLLTCHGHYCKAEQAWPDAHFFFASHRGTVAEPLCRACYYWDIRWRNVQKRYAAFQTTALGARLRGE